MARSARPAWRAGTKYRVGISRRGQQAFRLQLGASRTSFVDAVARKLNDGGLLIHVLLVCFIIDYMNK